MLASRIDMYKYRCCVKVAVCDIVSPLDVAATNRLSARPRQPPVYDEQTRIECDHHCHVAMLLAMLSLECPEQEGGYGSEGWQEEEIHIFYNRRHDAASSVFKICLSSKSNKLSIASSSLKLHLFEEGAKEVLELF